MQITIAPDVSRLKLDLQREQDRLARVGRRVAYELAHRAVAAIKADMRTTFDRPTPWVLNGVYVAPLHDENSATVDWKPGSAGAIPAEKILRAQIEGGSRRPKRFERVLAAAGILPAGHIAVPGQNMRLDAYGNVSGAQITQILSALRAFGEVGFLANQNRKREEARMARAQAKGKAYKARAPRLFFAIQPGHPSLPAGIYRKVRQGGHIMLMAFVPSHNYRARFAPARIVRQTVAREAAEVWNLGLSRQIPFRR